MAACIRCEEVTELYCQNIPICPRCADIIENGEILSQPTLPAKALAMAATGSTERLKRSA